jgi:3-oxoacyl-[acyl-carrier protein] reductase
VVTGAAGGIGRAIAIRMLAEGYDVALLDAVDAVHAVAQTAGAAGSHVLDVRDREAVRACFSDVVAQLGRLDVLVSSAGTCHRQSFEDTRPEHWQVDLDTNLSGLMWTCQAAVFPYMREQGYGRIVNVASVSGKVGGIGSVHPDGWGGRSGAGYAASKAGAINLTRWIAREVGKWGITCNAVAPGPIGTAMTAGQQYEFSDAPIARFGTADEVAHAVAYLASGHAAFTTGACLHVDGGLVRA